MTHATYLSFFILISALLAMTGCAATPNGVSVYEELGGQTGVERLTADFIREIAADERIRGRFKDSDIGRFHRMMQEHICALTGGGCDYTGDSMQRTHAGMDITRIEFNAVVEALMRAMDTNDVPQSVQNQLLGVLAPMHSDVVGL